MGKSIELKDAHGAVPNDGAGLGELVGQHLRGARADVQNQVVVSHVASSLDGSHRVGLELFGHHHVHRNGHGGATGFHGSDDTARLVHQGRFSQALADGQARCQHEGIGNAAAHDELVDLVGQALQDGQFGRDLAACHDGHQGALGLRQGLRHSVNFCCQQWPCTGDGRVLCDAVGAGLGAVRGAKSVVHKDVAQRSQLARQCFAVFLLANVDAAVFQHHHLARGDDHTVHPVGHEWHITTQQLS